MKRPVISVIVPVLNEAQQLKTLLNALATDPEQHEVLVVDGGSLDGSPEVAQALGARVLTASRGRGQQLAAGADAARGEILLFLHADTVLSRGCMTALRHALGGNTDAIGGNFRLLFDGQRGFDRWLEGFYAWLRSRGIYYGDSGIFLRSCRYREMGGIRPIPIMEDYDLATRMEAAGPTVCIDDPPLTTSSRRFTGRHPLVIFFGWLFIHLLFCLGVPPDRIAHVYDNERRRERPA
jgi:rSAM/selenodomain-associated transferase 2